jgi:hypothetical protein
MASNRKTESPNGSASNAPPAGTNTETGETSAPTPTSAQPPEMVRDQVELLKKLVAKDIVSKKELKYTKEGGDPRSLYTVFGVVNGTESGESNYGEWLCFKGSFEAVRTRDRQRFASDKLFLQDPAQGMLLSQFAHMKRQDVGATLGFSFEIGVKPSQRFLETQEGNSYEYTVKSVFKAKSHDPLAALREQVMPVLPPAELQIGLENGI